MDPAVGCAPAQRGGKLIMRNRLARELLYEYRAWPDDADRLRPVIAGRFRPRKEESRRDDYLLPVCQASEAFLPKIRGGRLFEIKQRLSRENGIEVWKRVTSEAFPLDPALSPLLSRIYPGAELGARDLDTPGHLLGALASHVFLCPTRKKRVLFKKGGCKAEITTVEAFGLKCETVALECRRPGPVREFLEHLPDKPLPNTSYGAWLRSQLGRGVSLSLIRSEGR